MNLLLWLVGRRCCYRIVGRSMYPTLSPGDKVWVDLRAYARSRPQEGEIVLARHPYRTNLLMVKRVMRVLSDGRCILVGDNADESTDSRTFGAIPKTYVLGRVILRPSLDRKGCTGQIPPTVVGHSREEYGGTRLTSKMISPGASEAH